MHSADRSDRSSEDLVRHFRCYPCARPRRPRERSGDGRVRADPVPAAASRRRDHPVRHRAQLLARHAAHREPGRALGGGQRLAELPANASCRHMHFNPSCTANPPTNTTLANYLECQAIRTGPQELSRVPICYPDDGDRQQRNSRFAGSGDWTRPSTFFRSWALTDHTCAVARPCDSSRDGSDGSHQRLRSPVRSRRLPAMNARLSEMGRERGQVVVMFALLIPVLFGLGAIVLDVGNWYVHKRHLQTQVDAAALAGAPSSSAVADIRTTDLANAPIAGTALEYAGDFLDLHPRSTRVHHHREKSASPGAGDVRVALNSAALLDMGDAPMVSGSITPSPIPATQTLRQATRAIRARRSSLMSRRRTTTHHFSRDSSLSA